MFLVFHEPLITLQGAATARKTIFLRSWNIRESSKIPCKYHLFINFLAEQKDRISHHRKVQSENFSVTSKYHIFFNFLAQRKTVFFISKTFKTRTFNLSLKMTFNAEENIISLFFVLLCKAEPPPSSFLRLPKLRKHCEKINSVPTYCVEKDSFCSQKSLTSTFPLS